VPRIVVVGSCNMDLVARAPRLPAPGETILDGEFYTAHGGKGANQAVAAARLGAAVVFVGRTGADSFGAQLRRGLEADGVDTTYLVDDPAAPTGVAIILVDHRGENSIVVASGANLRLTPQAVDQAAPAIQSADVLLLQLELPLQTVQHAAALAVRAGVPVVLNPAPARALPGDLLRLAHVLTPNRSEAGVLAGMAVHRPDDAALAAVRLVRRGSAAVVITLGACGAVVLERAGAQPQRLEPFRVEAVDATAAGDAFNAGLAVGLAAGHSLAEAARLGMAAGALAATRRGAQPSLPHRDEVDRLLGAAGG
jgi:ribokinase